MVKLHARTVLAGKKSVLIREVSSFSEVFLERGSIVSTRCIESENASIQFYQLYTHSLSLFLAAYKHADGKKIDGKRVVVDVERGRTVKSWNPRRLGKKKTVAFLPC